MKVRVFWFGRPGADGIETLVVEYRQRTARRWQAEDVRLKPSQGGRDKDPRRALRAEGDELVRRVPGGWTLIALDERGEELTSEEFAGVLRTFEERGAPGVAFAVGSDLGLAPGVTRGAARRLSLSRMTLPHSLARLLLWEQLFRAADILSGGGYHRRSIQWGMDGGSSR